MNDERPAEAAAPVRNTDGPTVDRPPHGEAHEPLEELDSALGDDDDGQSDTTSLASSILKNREEWGRSYHAYNSENNSYWGPNDEIQLDALDCGNHMINLMLDHRLFLAPIDPVSEPTNVIDLGCGTGIWAMDFADAYAKSTVTGIDLSPSQPTWVPPNCHFVVDDVESPWAFPKNHFDFVNLSCLMGSIADWPALYRQAYEHMKPGAWIQHLDIDINFLSDDGSIGPDHIMTTWSQTFLKAGEITGKTFRIAERMAGHLRDTGFQDVHMKWYKIPVGGWTKDPVMREIGQYNYHYCLQGCEGWALFLLSRVLQWEWDEIQVFIAKFKNALRDRRNHPVFWVGVSWGQKPVPPASSGTSQ